MVTLTDKQTDFKVIANVNDEKTNHLLTFKFKNFSLYLLSPVGYENFSTGSTDDSNYRTFDILFMSCSNKEHYSLLIDIIKKELNIEKLQELYNDLIDNLKLDYVEKYLDISDDSPLSKLDWNAYAEIEKSYHSNDRLLFWLFLIPFTTVICFGETYVHRTYLEIFIGLFFLIGLSWWSVFFILLNKSNKEQKKRKSMRWFDSKDKYDFNLGRELKV